jgi:hypothetical protein
VRRPGAGAGRDRGGSAADQLSWEPTLGKGKGWEDRAAGEDVFLMTWFKLRGGGGRRGGWARGQQNGYERREGGRPAQRGWWERAQFWFCQTGALSGEMEQLYRICCGRWVHGEGTRRERAAAARVRLGSRARGRERGPSPPLVLVSGGASE